MYVVGFWLSRFKLHAKQSGGQSHTTKGAVKAGVGRRDLPATKLTAAGFESMQRVAWEAIQTTRKQRVLHKLVSCHLLLSRGIYNGCAYILLVFLLLSLHPSPTDLY